MSERERVQVHILGSWGGMESRNVTLSACSFSSALLLFANLSNLSRLMRSSDSFPSPDASSLSRLISASLYPEMVAVLTSEAMSSAVILAVSASEKMNKNVKNEAKNEHLAPFFNARISQTPSSHDVAAPFMDAELYRKVVPCLTCQL